MEESIFPDRPTSKLYTENSIRVATFLGGPLVAGYLIADNYKQLGETRHIQTTWLIAILSTALIFAIAWFVPSNFPPYLLPIVYSAATYYLAQKLQGEKIKSHTAAGGQTWSMGRALLIGLAGLVIILGFVFCAVILFNHSIE